MALPSFAVTGTLLELLGNISGGELVGNGLGAGVLSAQRATFTPNYRGPVVYEGEVHWVREVTANVKPDGTLHRTGETVRLLANDAGLSVADLQWRIDVAGFTAWFDAPADGASVDVKDLVEESAAAKQATAQSSLDAAVGAYVEANRAQFRTRAVPITEGPDAGLYQWVDANDEPVGDPVRPPVRESVTVDRLLQIREDTGQAIIIPHRGAGMMLAPENTLIAHQIGASYGLGVVDGGDWRTTKDGALICVHDSTTGRISNRDRTVSDMSGPEALLTTVDAGSWFGGGFGDMKMMLAEELFSTLGGTTVLMPEAKDAAAGPLLAGLIQRMGIQNSVIPNSFDVGWLAPLTEINCPHLMLLLATLPSAPTRASHLAAGINWYSVPWNGSITVSDVETLVDEGFHVLIATVYRANHVTQVHNWLSIKDKITAWYADDPFYFAHALDAANANRYRRTTDPFATLTYYHGHLSGTDGFTDFGPKYRGSYKGTRRWAPPVDTSSRWVLMGWACPLANPASYTIDFNMTFDRLGDDATRWMGVVVGAPTDRGYMELGGNTWETGYQCYMRQTGELVMFKRTNATNSGNTTAASAAIKAPLVTTSDLAAGTPITSIPVTALPAALVAGLKFRLPNDQIATVATGGASLGATSVPVNSITPTTAVPSGSSLPQTVPMRVVVNSTTITLSRQDSVSASVSITDSDHRGPYWYAGQASTFTNPATGLSGSFSEMTVS